MISLPASTRRRFVCLLPIILVSLAPFSARAQSDYSPPYVFTTLAGTSSIGSTDGPAALARFYSPAGIAVDNANNLYVADSDNHTIRKISVAGLVTTLAGSAGLSGNSDGQGTEARFNSPQAISLDAFGNLYVADSGNHVTRKITPTGLVSTPQLPAPTANDGTTPGYVDPINLARDAMGNRYVVDNKARNLQKISTTGQVTVMASGISGDSIAVDANGTVYAGLNDCTIIKITPSGTVSIFAGGRDGAAPSPMSTSGRDGLGSEARFGYTLSYSLIYQNWSPTSCRFGGLALDSKGNLLVADIQNHTIRKITPAAEVSTLAGIGIARSYGNVDGNALEARFDGPTALAVMPDGNLVVADPTACTIRKVTPSGNVSTFAGLAGQIGSADGSGATARFNLPQGVAVDKIGNVLVADTRNYTIRRISPGGQVSTWAGIVGQSGTTDGPGSTAHFKKPTALCVDADGNVYVADRSQIRKITPGGEVSKVPQSEGISQNSPDPFGIDTYEIVEALTVDSSGNLYAHYQTHTVTPHGIDSASTSNIRKFSRNGIVSVFASFPKDFVHRVHSLTVDSQGTVYIADSADSVIRRISKDGEATTLAGLSRVIGGADGLGTEARFQSPFGIAVAPSGLLYVSDSGSIRQGVPVTAPLIVTQPRDQTVATGGTVQFSVTTAAVPEPTYQWFYNGAPFAGATSQNLSFTNARPADAGNYSVRVTNAFGSVTSTTATLTVTPAPPPVMPPPAANPGTGGSSGSGSSKGGGGGAPSAWFSLALAGAVAARHLDRRRALIK